MVNLSGFEDGEISLSRFTNYPYFICFWDYRSKDEKWVNKQWPLRENIVEEEKNLIGEILVDRDNIILSQLYIKPGLMKQFVKTLNKEDGYFNNICRKLPVLSWEELKAGIFHGPRVRGFMKDTHFQDSMNNAEASVWYSLSLIVRNFFRNYKADIYSELEDSGLPFLSTSQ